MLRGFTHLRVTTFKGYMGNILSRYNIFACLINLIMMYTLLIFIPSLVKSILVLFKQ